MGAILSLRMARPDLSEGIGFSKEVLAKNGALLRLTLSPDEKYRIFLPLQDIHPDVREAVVLLEDRYFWYHPGINPLSMFRAAFSLTTDRKVGASTITMQMVRLKHKIYTRSVLGKLRQMSLAVYYEALYSKDEILETYLNLTPYGGNIEGLEAASLIYFGKSAGSLSLLESLTLAVIPQNPLKRNLNQRDLNLVDEARKRLIEKWIEVHPEDKVAIQEGELPVLSNRIRDLPFKAPHFVEESIRRYPLQYVIRSTLDLELQEKIEDRFKLYFESLQGKGIKNGSVVLVEAASREVKAWIGSREYFDSEIQGQINGVVIQRSPGSTLKPFVYARAMDEGLIHPGTMLKDTPASFGGFDPENFDRKYLGPLSATEALTQSRNVPAITLASLITPGFLYNMLKNIGVENLKSEKTYGLGTTIGTAPLSSLDLASLYTALYNRGKWAPLKISTTEKSFPDLRILSPESSYLVLDMLSKAPRDQSALINDEMLQQFPMAWKTGTSYGFRDAWVAGVFGPYVLVVWLGNFDYSENPHLIGREVAAPLFFQIAQLFSPKVLNKNQAWRNPFGLNLKKVDVCELSGGMPTEACPHHRKELFIPSVSPIAHCDLHRKIMVSKQTGLRLCGNMNAEFKEEVYEFWPSDLLDIFDRFGVKRKTPPAFDPHCKGGMMASGTPPEIVSPKKDIKYMISFSKSKLKEKLPLRAITDADVKELTWYVNRELVAFGKADKTMFYEAGPGHYDVMVIDDQGRTSSREVEVSAVR